MKFIIIGLGYYGRSVAEELSKAGHEVICADNNPNKINMIQDKVEAAFIIDATEESALKTLPLNDVDVVIVSIGEDLGASVRAIALLKKNNDKHIYARASDPIHHSIV